MRSCVARFQLNRDRKIAVNRRVGSPALNGPEDTMERFLAGADAVDDALKQKDTKRVIAEAAASPSV